MTPNTNVALDIANLTHPPHFSGGHWAKNGLLAAATPLESGLLKGQKAHCGVVI